MEDKLINTKQISSSQRSSKGRSSYSLQKLKTSNVQMTFDYKQNCAWKNDISLNSAEINEKEHYNRTWPHLKEKYQVSNSVGTISDTLPIAVTAEIPPNQDSFMYRNSSITTFSVDSSEENNKQITGTLIDCKEKSKDWKEIRKIKKIAIKAEKKRLKEEDARKKLYEPKDERIKIVDENFFSLISRDDKTNEQSLFLLNAVNFPTLKSTKVVHNEQEHKNAAGTAMGSHARTSSIDENLCNEITSHNVHQGLNLSDVPRKVKKQPKRKDPIQFDISQAIKASGKVNKTKKSKYKLKRQVNIISGNDLDSTNPRRCRGKKREVPKRRKLTKLKLAIIHEREIKKNLRAMFQEKSTFTASQKYELNETIGMGEGCVFYNSVPCPSFNINIINKNQLYEPNNILKNPLKLFLGSASSAVNDELNTHKSGVFTSTPLQRFAKENVTCVKNIEEFSGEKKYSDASESSTYINTKTSQKFLGSTSDSNLCALNLEEGAGSSICSNIQIKQELDSTSNEFDTTHQCQTEDVVERDMAVKNFIHSRKFREYCNHFITDEINASVTALLQDILKFHDRLYEKDPIKANAKRRHITGLREAKKYLGLKKIKILIIAPDLENISGKDGINEAIKYLVETAEVQKVPHVFALSRKILGKLTFKKVPVSCVGVINYEGSENNFHSLMEAIPSAREQYNDALKKAAESLGFQNVEKKAIDSTKEDVIVKQEVISSLIAKLKETTLEIKSEPCQFLKTIENNEDTE